MFCKIVFQCRTLNCFLLCQLRKKSPDFFPVLTPQEDGILFVMIFHMQSLQMQESFSTEEGLTFQVVPWKMFHIIRSLTHYIDVSACLYKDLEQSVLATELSSKLFDPRFLYFDNVIMHLTQGHCYFLTYRKLPEKKLVNASSREIQSEVITWTPKQIHCKYPLFYSYASFLIC